MQFVILNKEKILKLIEYIFFYPFCNVLYNLNMNILVQHISNISYNRNEILEYTYIIRIDI